MLIGTQRTALREIKPGTYCAAFSPLVTASDPNSSFVELRTVYGNSTRQPINLPSIRGCDLDGRLQLAQPNVLVLCSMIGDDISRVDSGCSQDITPCKAEKIVLYSADKGGYNRITEARRSTIRLPEPQRSYEFVAVGPGNVLSTPVQFPRPPSITP